MRFKSNISSFVIKIFLVSVALTLFTMFKISQHFYTKMTKINQDSTVGLSKSFDSTTASYETNSGVKVKACQFGSKILNSVYRRRPRFQRVLPTEEILFTFTAYFETYEELRFIRIIGLGRINNNKLIYCSLFDENYKYYFGVRGSSKSFHDDDLWNLKYRGGFIYCILPEGIKEPAYISLRTSFYPTKIACKLSNLIKVEYPEKQKLKYEFVACVKPIYNFGDTFALLEWIEFNKLMGIEHFTIYIYSIDKEARCAANYYGDQIEIRDWNPPLRDSPDLLENGLMSAMNDCLYKYKNIAKYILFSDLDEFLVPNITSNFSTMLSSINEEYKVKDGGSVAFYKFMNGFFFKCWPDYIKNFTDNPLTNRIIKNMITMKKNKLTQPFFDPNAHHFENRTKYIAQTSNSIEAGVHYMWHRRSGSIRVDVNEKIAYSHHYRINLSKVDCKNNTSVVEDNSAHKYIVQVANNLAKNIADITASCGASNTSKYTKNLI